MNLWGLAPKDHNYIAQDLNGKWYSFEDEPKIIEKVCEWVGGSSFDGTTTFLIREGKNQNWKNTLEKRSRVSKEYILKVRALI